MAPGGQKVGVAGCGADADGGQGGAGAIADGQQQELRCVCAAVHRWYTPLGAEAGQLSVHGGEAAGGGDGPQQGHGADPACHHWGSCPQQHSMPFRRPALRWQWRTSGTIRGCLMHGCGMPCSGGGGDVPDRVGIRVSRQDRVAEAEAACHGRSMPSDACEWRTWCPPMLWARRIGGKWWCWRAQGIESVCTWNRAV